MPHRRHPLQPTRLPATRLAPARLVLGLASLCSALLSGCGGGSGNTASTTSPPTTTPTAVVPTPSVTPTPTVTPTPAPAPSPATTSVNTCVPGSGHDYQVGPDSGQLATLAQVPWESLSAGDTVRIFYSATPYRGHILLAAQGTANAPVRVCGVKGSNGERPIIDGANAVARPGLSYTSASYGHIQESRAVVMIDRLGTQDWGTAHPQYVQIDGLEIRGANPSNTFTNSTGAVQAYEAFGGCIWVERGHHVTIADNVVHDCTNGIFSRSTDDGDFAVTKDLRIASNYIYGNGVSGDDHEHNSYVQSVGVVYEFNHYGPLRSGALGGALKDRSVGPVIRYNRIEEGSRALDLVEAEDYPVTATADPAYRSTYVYGNQIVKSGDTGSLIHYGGDHFGSTPGSMWGEPIFRKGTLYFFNNTVYATGSNAAIFQISTTEETVEAWNNVFVFANTVADAKLRMGWQDVNTAYWTPNGIVHLGRNWINSRWVDTDVNHPLQGAVTGQANLLTGSTAPVNLSTLRPLAGSVIIDAAQANVSGAAGYAVDHQLDASFNAAARPVNGAALDLGALEY